MNLLSDFPRPCCGMPSAKRASPAGGSGRVAHRLPPIAMPRVQIEILPWLSQQLRPGTRGSIILEAEGTTLRDVLGRLAADEPNAAALALNPDDARWEGHVQVLLNDRLVIWRGEADTPLQAGDRLTLVPPYVGG